MKTLIVFVVGLVACQPAESPERVPWRYRISFARPDESGELKAWFYRHRCERWSDTQSRDCDLGPAPRASVEVRVAAGEEIVAVKARTDERGIVTVSLPPDVAAKLTTARCQATIGDRDFIKVTLAPTSRGDPSAQALAACAIEGSEDEATAREDGDDSRQPQRSGGIGTSIGGGFSNATLTTTTGASGSTSSPAILLPTIEGKAFLSRTLSVDIVVPILNILITDAVVKGSHG